MAITYQIIAYAIFFQYATFWMGNLLDNSDDLKWEVCIFHVLCASDYPSQMGTTSDCLSIALRVSDGNEAHVAKYFYWG